MQQAGLRHDICEFISPSVMYLRYSIDAQGLHPIRHKVVVITEASIPQNVTELCAYMNLLNYNSKFMQNF